MVPIPIVLEHWFVRKRTFAIGICSAVTGLATFGIPSVIAWIIEHLGLRTAFLLETVVILCIVAVAFLLVRDHPGQKNLLPYGGAAVIVKQMERHRGAVLTKRDWLLLVPMLLLGAMTKAGYSHLGVLVIGAGYSAQMTAIALTVAGVSLMLGKCIYGWASERIRIYQGNRLFGAVLLAGMLLCCFCGKSKELLFVSVTLYGAGLSLTTVGQTVWSADLSTPETYSATVRWFQVGDAAGNLLFSALPGILADWFGGSYVPAYLFFTACTIFVVLSVQILYRRHGYAGAGVRRPECG